MRGSAPSAGGGVLFRRGPALQPAARSSLALLGGCLAEELTVAAREMRCGHEAAREPDREDRHTGLEEELARTLQAQAKIIPRRRLADILPEQAFELPRRQAGFLRERGTRQRLLEVALHEFGHAEDLRVGDAEPGTQLHSLPLIGLPHAVVDQLVGHEGG